MKKLSLVIAILSISGCHFYDNGNAPANTDTVEMTESEYSQETQENQTSEDAGMNASVMGAQIGNYKTGNPYNLDNITYTPAEDYTYVEEGVASWYGNEFMGQKTANGEEFSGSYYTAAHKTLPLPSVIKITNLDNDKVTYARVNDRGPFTKDRLIDVSEAVANELDFKDKGSANVRVEIAEAESIILKNRALNSEVSAAPVEEQKPTELKSDELKEDPAPQTQQPAAVAATTGEFELQAAAMNEKSAADELAAKVGGKVVNEGGFFKVRVGPFVTKEEAEVAKKLLTDQGLNPGLIKAGKWASWN